MYYSVVGFAQSTTLLSVIADIEAVARQAQVAVTCKEICLGRSSEDSLWTCSLPAAGGRRTEENTVESR